MAKKKSTKIAVALAFLEANPGATAYAAALHAGLPATTVYTAVKRKKAHMQGVCPTCGSPVKPHSEPC